MNKLVTGTTHMIIWAGQIRVVRGLNVLCENEGYR